MCFKTHNTPCRVTLVHNLGPLRKFHAWGFCRQELFIIYCKMPVKAALCNRKTDVMLLV